MNNNTRPNANAAQLVIVSWWGLFNREWTRMLTIRSDCGTVPYVPLQWRALALNLHALATAPSCPLPPFEENGDLIFIRIVEGLESRS